MLTGMLLLDGWTGVVVGVVAGLVLDLVDVVGVMMVSLFLALWTSFYN